MGQFGPVLLRHPWQPHAFALGNTPLAGGLTPRLSQADALLKSQADDLSQLFRFGEKTIRNLDLPFEHVDNLTRDKAVSIQG